MALADLIPLSFVEVGKIKLGGLGAPKTSTTGTTYRQPEKYDHFEITTLYRDQAGNLIPDKAVMDSLAEFTDTHDKKLRSIPVMFGSNNIEDVMQTSYVWYIGKRLGARSDGIIATFFADPTNGEFLDAPREYKWSSDYLQLPDPKSRHKRGEKPKPLFKRFSTLNCMIASPAARFGGFYRFRTTSEISTRQLYGSMMHFCGPRGLCPGTLRGLVFRLVVREMLVCPNGQTSKVYVVHVEYSNSDLKALQGAASEQKKLELESMQMTVETERQYKMLIASQAEDDPDEDLVTDDELPMLPVGKVPSQAEKQGAALEEIEKGIKAAPTLEKLGEFWKCERMLELWRVLDSAQQDAVVGIKNTRRKELSNPAPKPASTEPPPADETPLEHEQSGPPQDDELTPAKAPTKCGREIATAIDKLIVEAGTNWNDVRTENAEALGITAGRIADLDADQATALVAVLKAQIAAKEHA